MNKFMKSIYRLFIIAVCFVTIGFSSCTEDAITPTYELRFTSTSDNPYLIEVNGSSEVIPGNTYISYFIPQVTYAWKVTQQSGYLLYPTVREGTVTLDEDKEIVFP